MGILEHGLDRLPRGLSVFTRQQAFVEAGMAPGVAGDAGLVAALRGAAVQPADFVTIAALAWVLGIVAFPDVIRLDRRVP